MSGRSVEWDLGRSVVFVPCPGRPACPDRLYEVDGHRHFQRRDSVRVCRVVPGCWEAWCGRCAFLTDTGLVTQVGSWERAMLRAGEHVQEVHALAGRVLSSSDPQPPAGTVVRDDCGTTWVNSGCYPAAWMPLDREDDPESWTKVAGNYGPVTVIGWGTEGDRL